MYNRNRRYFFQLMLLVLGIAALAVVLVRVVPSHFSSAEEALFLAKNDAAMARMMAGMKIKPSNDVDRDFVAMMVPHHQAAIDMAQIELIYGHNRLLFPIAQEIIATQQQEIVAMRLALGESSSCVPSSRQPSLTSRQLMSHYGMPMQAGALT